MYRSFLLGFLLCLMCIAALLHPVPSHAAPQADPPLYLMYFTDTPAPQFIIEQVDGSDSRIFGADLMPPDTNHVEGPGWSPSGDWFAWTANSLQNHYNTGDHPFVLSADGQTRVTALDGFNWAEMQWSPVDDTLLVAGLSDAPEVNLDETREPRNLNLVIGLLDPARDAWIARHDIPLPEDTPLLYLDYQLRWHPDNQSAMVFWRDTTADAPADYDFYIVRRDGSTAITHFPVENLILNRQAYKVPPLLSPFGEVATLSESGVITLINVIDSTEKVFAVPPDETFLNMQWHNEGRALIKTELTDCVTESPCNSVWVYDYFTMTRLIPNDAPITYLAPAPDFSGVVYTDGRNRVHYVPSSGSGLVNFEWILDIERTTFVHWNATGQVILKVEDGDFYKDSYVALDLSGAMPVELGQFETDRYNAQPTLSPHGHTADFAFSNIYMIDLATGDTLVLPPDPRTYFAASNGEFTWHPALPYAILWENALVAGGGDLRYTGIVSRDGTLRRGLGFCQSPTEICADWLPNQVSLSNLAPGTDQFPLAPINRFPTATGTYYWLDELIWSPDGTQIAGGGEFRSMGGDVPFWVWDVATGDLVTTFDEVVWEETIIWEGDSVQIAPREVAPPDILPFVLATSPNGSIQFTETDHFEYTPQLLDAEGNVVASLDDYLQYWHPTASFSPTDPYVAVSSPGGYPVRILNSATGEVLATLRNIPSNAVAFSPDGLYLAVAVSKEIHIYEVAALITRE